MTGRSSTIDRVAVIALVIAAISQLVALAVVPQYGFDVANHLSWIKEWHSLWGHGIYYPRWLPDLFAGYGSPAFYFYPPLTYALSSLLFLTLPSASVMTITKLVIALTLMASGVTMWLYLRRVVSLGSSIAFFGALLYVFAPYRFLDYSARCALSEHIAFVFVPLVFWGAQRMMQRGRLWPSAVMFVASLALLILTNIPASTTVFLGLLVVILVRPPSEWTKHLLRIAYLSSLAFGLVAFYLWPVLFVHSDLSVFTVGWVPGFIGTGSPLLGLLNGFAPTLDALNSLCYIGAAILLFHYWRERRQDTTLKEALGGVLLIFVLLQLPYISLFLFYNVPPFKMIQVPSRLTILLLFFLATRWAEHLSGLRKARIISIVVIGWAAATVVIAGWRIVHHPEFVFTEPTSAGSLEYKTSWMHPGLDTEYTLAAKNIAPNNNRDSILGEGVAGNTYFQRGPYRDSLIYEVAVSDTSILHRAYWRSWDVRVDGKPVPFWPDSMGRLAMLTPAGKHTITTSFEPTSYEIIGRYISLATLLVSILSFVFFQRRAKRER